MVLELVCCTVDLEREEVSRDGAVSALTEQEAGLLRYLSQRPGEVVSRQELLREVWGWRARGVTRAVDNTVMRLRAKIEPAAPGAAPRHLLTVRGVGYRYEGPTPTAAAAALVGRDAALSALSARLRAGGLHTLVGPGGVGKTALAEAALARSRGVFCDLSAAQTARDAAELVAAAIGASGPDPVQAVAGCISSQPGVLVLDNVEQLVEDCWEVFQLWAGAAGPGTALLVTSRALLGLPEEQPFPLAPLATDDAVALLQARSQRAAAPPTAAERELVEMVDGLPLAIELIAGWAELAGPAQLVGQLRGQLGQLHSRRRRGARHRSLQAVLDSSWALLADDEQRTMRRLSVFSGGFSLEAATAVCEAPVLLVVGRLVDKSMLQRQRDAGFRMLALVAADAARRLAADPAEQARARLLHARWMAGTLAGMWDDVQRARGRYSRWVRQHRADLLDVVARFQEARPALAAEAVLGLGVLAMEVGDPAAELARVRSLSDRLPLGRTWARLVRQEATWLTRLGRAEEVHALLEAVLPAVWDIDTRCAGSLACAQAFQLTIRGRGPEAAALLTASLPRLAEDESAHAMATGYLGLAWYAQEALARAELLLREAIARLDATGDRVARDWFAEKHAIIQARLGAVAAAAETTAALLERAEDAQMSDQAAVYAFHLGVLCMSLRRHEEAAQRLEYALSLNEGRSAYTDTLAWMAYGDLAALSRAPEQAEVRWQRARAALGRDHYIQQRYLPLLDARGALLRGAPEQISATGDAPLDAILDALRTGQTDASDPELQLGARIHRALLRA